MCVITILSNLCTKTLWIIRSNHKADVKGTRSEMQCAIQLFVIHCKSQSAAYSKLTLSSMPLRPPHTHPPPQTSPTKGQGRDSNNYSLAENIVYELPTMGAFSWPKRGGKAIDEGHYQIQD
ncbi:hypothetical protein EDD18DRAFT_1110974 [Armillaria luteobubalina]|uniref:Uncharacterized protein n=1 Tax=Armillaria luteobubalina TaxID=153913 RepID=A0AA39UEZ9_9AGAR|nr:hypothetical protein EDD18DRAFT_1110974 [Armillaria luteobubalina]